MTQGGSYWPLLVKTMSSRFPSSSQHVLTISPSPSTDLEHEDCAGGLLHGGPLAEGHREELGGGGGERHGGSPNPDPGLLSEGCSPLQGQLSQVFTVFLHVESQTIPLFSDKARTFSHCALVQGKNTVIHFLCLIFASWYVGKPERDQILPWKYQFAQNLQGDIWNWYSRPTKN